MSYADFQALMPEILLLGGGSLILLLEAFVPATRKLFTPLALLSTVLAGWQLWMLGAATPFAGQIETTAVTKAFSLVVLVAMVLSLLASEGYLRRNGILAGEYHALFLWCGAGLLLMIRANELLTIFLALELLSLCLYSLSAFHRRLSLGSEAAIKYFLMGAFVSAFVLLGIALLYGETGSTELATIATAFRAGSVAPLVATLGIVLLIAGFSFKMSLVPFHAWSPDTYQGAPSPFVAFLSVAPKAASAAVLMRVLGTVMSGSLGDRWPSLVAALAVLSMVGGNLLALVQRDIKRMLAYSGIAHMGYLLLAMVSLNQDSTYPVITYLLAYALMNAAAFAAVSVLFSRPGEQHLISDLAGLGYRYPVLGACLAIAMLSLGGIPPTFGFYGKYVVFLHAVQYGHVGLAIVGVLASLVGVFYYLRVVYSLYMKSAADSGAALSVDRWGQTAAFLAASLILLFGIWPWRVLEWVLGGSHGPT